MAKSIWLPIISLICIESLECGCHSSASEGNDAGKNDSGRDAAPNDGGGSDADANTDAGTEDAGEDAYVDPCADASPPDCVRYVNVNVPDGGDGLSWNTAFRTVQEGIDSAYQAANPDGGLFDECDVWVAAGTYYVYRDSPKNTIQMKLNVSIWGGFNGTELLRCKRDIKGNGVILEGNNPSANERVYHIVTGSDDSSIDGFTIQHGSSQSDDWISTGGGIINYYQSPRVSNVIFTKNSNVAMANYHSNAEVTSCSFIGNWGGIYNNQSIVVITNSDFLWNGDGYLYGDWYYGGAIYGGDARIQGCVFLENGADYGGAIGGAGTLNISNSVFAYNSVVENGGAISWNGTINIVNSVFAGNQVEINSPQTPKPGGGIAGGTGLIYNSIFWNNFPEDIETHYTFYNSLICQSDQIDELKENFCEDPMFVGTVLKPNGWPLPLDGGLPDLHLREGSPCIDKADDSKAPATDIEGHVRVDIPGVGTPGAKADVGAYEYRPKE